LTTTFNFGDEPAMVKLPDDPLGDLWHYALSETDRRVDK
jgi:hypothetical protein